MNLPKICDELPANALHSLHVREWRVEETKGFLALLDLHHYLKSPDLKRRHLEQVVVYQEQPVALLTWCPTARAQYKLAALKKPIYSLLDVVDLLEAACRRYLDFAGTLENRSPARHDLDKVSRTVCDPNERTVCDPNERTWRGFNFFLEEDRSILLAVLRGEFAINGLSNRRLRSVLPGKSPSQISRILKRLRMHGLIKKVGNTYRYYLTALGRRLLIAGNKLIENILLPGLMPAKV